MTGQVEPADAARALSEIDQRREQAIRRKVFPGWWWWAYAVLIVEFSLAVESGRGVVAGIGIAVFVVGSLVVDVPVRRAARAAPLRRGLAGWGSARRTLLGLAGFAAVVIGATLATGLGLKAAGASQAATIATAVGAVAFAAVGPMLVRWEAAVLVRRSGRQG
ncbi:MAG: hypothetical protein JF587_09585 [Catenulisporales bacterium]|nr:hypothetical protein [Catenulisporales bacterium]